MILLRNKKRETYEEAFKLIELGCKKRGILDYDDGKWINAVSEAYDNAETQYMSPPQINFMNTNNSIHLTDPKKDPMQNTLNQSINEKSEIINEKSEIINDLSEEEIEIVPFNIPTNQSQFKSITVTTQSMESKLLSGIRQVEVLADEKNDSETTTSESSENDTSSDTDNDIEMADNEENKDTEQVTLERETNQYIFNINEEYNPNAPKQLQPTAFALDFEITVFKAIANIYGALVYILGCYFHFIQCQIKKINTLGMKRPYKKNHEFRRALLLLWSIAFLPVNLMKQWFYNIQSLVVQKASKKHKLKGL